MDDLKCKLLCTNSAMENKWIIKQKDYELIESIKSTYNLSYLVASTIANREIEFDEIEKFLSPKLKEVWQDPYVLPDFEKAIQTLYDAVINNKTIGIIGDYDVDGVCSSTIWQDVFNHLKIKTHIWLPNRQTGYGPGETTTEFFKENKVDLMLFVDCGSTSDDFINANYEMPMVIIDHHTANLSETVKKKIVVNPHRSDANKLEQKDFLTLCATGLSFIVANQLLKKLEHNDAQNILTNLLDLVALGTVCDIMPFSPLNRALVAKGIKIIEEQKRPGIKILLQKAQVKFPLTASDLGFYLGPRLNAAGRMKEPYIAFNLLSTKKENDAIGYAIELENLNKERKVMQQYAFDEASTMAKELIAKQPDIAIICLANESWHAGVIGIVAAMIQEKFEKPTIIGSIEEGKIKASARSQILNIGHIIQKAALEERIITGGGHYHAGGLSATIEQWESFANWANEQAKLNEYEKPPLEIDAIVELEQIEEDYKKLGPHGPLHEEIIILTKNVRIQTLFEASTYIRFTMLQNYQSHTFFLQPRQNKLIQQLKKAHEENRMISMLVKLNEKGYHKIEDFMHHE